MTARDDCGGSCRQGAFHRRSPLKLPSTLRSCVDSEKSMWLRWLRKAMRTKKSCNSYRPEETVKSHIRKSAKLEANDRTHASHRCSVRGIIERIRKTTSKRTSKSRSRVEYQRGGQYIKLGCIHARLFSTFPNSWPELACCCPRLPRCCSNLPSDRWSLGTLFGADRLCQNRFDCRAIF